MPIIGFDGLAICGIPDPDRLIGAGSGYQAAIGRKGNVPGHSAMALQFVPKKPVETSHNFTCFGKVEVANNLPSGEQPSA